MFLCLARLPATGVSDLEGEGRAAKNMELSDGLLLQVNNGEQWCNRWKHPIEESVSHWHKLVFVLLVYCRISSICVYC